VRNHFGSQEVGRLGCSIGPRQTLASATVWQKAALPAQLEPLECPACQSPPSWIANQRIAAAQGRSGTFEIDPEAKNVLRAGLDVVGLTLQSLEVIQTFRARDIVSRPWIYWE
jgi:hypothetical protein